MEFYSTGHDPTRGARLVCRNWRWALPLFAIVYAAIVAVLWCVPGAGFFFWVNAPICALMVLGAIRNWRSLSRPDNWMLVVESQGVWINLRDAAYRDVPPGETVVFLPHGEVLSVREHVHRYETPSSDGGVTSHKDRCLDLIVAEGSSERVAAALETERQLPAPSREYLGGWLKVSSVGGPRQPVEVPEPGVLRIAASRPGYRMTPRVKRVLATLAEFAAVDPQDERTDAPIAGADDATIDRRVAELARRGQRMAASKLLVEHRGLSHGAAWQAVDRLSSSPPPRPDDRADG